MLTVRPRATWRLLATLAIAVMMLGCDKNPAGNDEDDEEEERGPDGVPAYVIQR